jgi:nucleotide-binding universal stress UspA family protein
MKPIRRVLFPTDFSDNARDAIPHVLEMAARFEAHVHVVHVLESAVHPTDFAWSATSIQDFAEKRKDVAEDRLQDLVDELGLAPEHISTAVIFGNPFEQIVSYAQEHDIDLIVMATHGRTGLSHLLLGSTAERVVRLSTCPVMTIKGHKHQQHVSR